MGNSGYLGQADRESEAKGERSVSDTTKFRVTLLTAAVLATLTLAAQVAAVSFHSPIFGILALLLSVPLLPAMFVLFIAGLFRFFPEGLWFAVPMIATWALPIYFVYQIKPY